MSVSPSAVAFKPVVFPGGLYLSESSFSCVAAITCQPVVIIGATDLYSYFARGGRVEPDGIAGVSDAGKSESFV